MVQGLLEGFFVMKVRQTPILFLKGKQNKKAFDDMSTLTNRGSYNFFMAYPAFQFMNTMSS